MQINLISGIYKTQFTYEQPRTKSVVTSKPDVRVSQPIAFYGTQAFTKTITTQIEHEKSKLMRVVKDILSTEVPVLSPEEKAIAMVHRMESTVRRVEKKREAILNELQYLNEDTILNPQQKYNRARELQKELTKLFKTKLTPLEEKQPASENYDYVLINKFKTAIMNDNFDFESIYQDHYQPLEEIETVEEFKEKYPSIRIPANPKDVITQKILDTLPRRFYIDLANLFESDDEEHVSNSIIKFIENYCIHLSGQFVNKTPQDLLNLLGERVVRAILGTLERLNFSGTFDEPAFEQIPEVRKSILPQITEDDEKLLDVDYDKYVLSTLRNIYLNKEKINKLEYVDGETKIVPSSLKSSAYKFERAPEKVKKLIIDAKKPRGLQREYPKFTTDELIARIEHFTGLKIAQDDRLLERIIDFSYCKFTGEDKPYVIKFLQMLDDINDGKTSLAEGLKIIVENDIRPHGTVKVNEQERKLREERLKLEQQKQIELNNLKADFNDAINKLYELNMSSVAERFFEFYPENYDNETVQNAESVIKIVQDSLALKVPAKIKIAILRREIFSNYTKSSELSQSEMLQDAIKYSNNFSSEEMDLRSGQYLLNREAINNYPSSLEVVQYPKVLKKIMEKFGEDKNLATIYLCKYENYKEMSKSEKQHIINILNIFDSKNPDDRILLKDIIENDYVKIDTVISGTDSRVGDITILAKPKQAILNKYKFPKCVDLFKEFEEAGNQNVASEYGTSGIKKTGANNEALDYKMELKIMGYPDRLFSSNNDYRFDVYSEKGLHK